MRGSQIQSACSVVPTCTWFGLGTVGPGLIPLSAQRRGKAGPAPLPQQGAPSTQHGLHAYNSVRRGSS